MSEERSTFALLRPVPFLAVLLLLLNDHVLKKAWPGFVTGKLSDVAGMIFFPVFLAAITSTFVPSIRRSPRAHDRVLLVACVATAIVFTLTKTTTFGNETYRVVWGAMQWPLRALRAWLAGRSLPAIAPVTLVKDPTDVLAVPFVLLAYLSGRAGSRVPRVPACAKTDPTP